MKIDDRGLGDVVYLLTTGNGDPQFFPGMNVLVEDESQPGGLWDEMRHLEMDTFSRFRGKYHDSQDQAYLLLVRSKRETLVRKLCLKMFHYGLLFAPLLQSGDRGTEDLQKKWNQFWGCRSPFPDEVEAAMGEQLLRDFTEMTKIWNDLPHKEDEDPGV